MKYLPTSPRDWWQFLSRLGRFYNSAAVPGALKFATVALCALYFILPIDFLPDFLPIVGQLDDVSVIFLIHMLMVGWAGQKYPLDGEKTLQTLETDAR